MSAPSIPLHQITVQQLQNLDDDVRLVVMHPNYAQQHLILGELLAASAAAYVRFQGTNLTLASLQEQYNTQVDTFPHFDLVVLDECDRAQSTDFEQFLSTVMEAGRISRVIILTRRLPSGVINNPELRAHARFIPTEEGLMLWDYARHDQATGVLLEVRSLGAGRVLLNGRPVDNWDGLLPRSLFFYLVDRGMTTRSEIFETFWPNLSVREATNVFHVTKRKISEVLGVDLTVYWSGFYHIAPHVHLSYDAALFSEAIQDSAVVAADEAADLLHRAMMLYRGDFLTSIEMPWTQKRRQDLRQNYSEALIALAKHYERSEQSARALTLYLRASTNNNHREDLAHNIMRLYRDLGMHSDAVAIYQRLHDELQHQLGVAPAPQLQELAATIQQEMGSSA